MVLKGIKKFNKHINKKKKIVLIVSGGIAAYKACDIVSALKKQNIDIQVVMTAHACQFVNPLTLAALSSNEVIYEMFDNNNHHKISHISLAAQADLILIAPATANFIAKLANGIADDFASTLCLAADGKKIMIFPAMNVNMLQNPATTENIKTLQKRHFFVSDCDYGTLACGITAKGKLTKVENIIKMTLLKLKALEIKNKITAELNKIQPNRDYDFSKIRLLINAGPCREKIDPVRFISNYSSGKMGLSLCKTACMLGFNISLCLGSVEENIQKEFESLVDNSKVLQYQSYFNIYQSPNADSMNRNMMALHNKADICICSAAVSDYTPLKYQENKIKKNSSSSLISLQLTKTQDILKNLGEKYHDGKTILVGFAAETNNIMVNALTKLQEKHCDILIANDVSADKVFGKDNSEIIIFRQDNGNLTHEVKKEQNKDDQAYNILLETLKLYYAKKEN